MTTATKSKPGPKPRAGRTSLSRLEVRMTDDELAEIRALAEAAELTVSEYVRKRLWPRRRTK